MICMTSAIGLSKNSCMHACLHNCVIDDWCYTFSDIQLQHAVWHPMQLATSVTKTQLLLYDTGYSCKLT